MQIAYYQEMAAVTAPAQAQAVQAKYGITFHGDLAAQLMSRHPFTSAISQTDDSQRTRSDLQAPSRAGLWSQRRGT
jgi:hypothetical protein